MELGGGASEVLLAQALFRLLRMTCWERFEIHCTSCSTFLAAFRPWHEATTCSVNLLQGFNIE